MPSVAFSQGLVPCNGPDCEFSHLIDLFIRVFEFMILFGIIVSSLAFAYAGFLYITSQGNTSKISRATKIFTNFAVGLVVLLSAFLIVELILNSLDVGKEFRKGVIPAQQE